MLLTEISSLLWFLRAISEHPRFTAITSTLALFIGIILLRLSLGRIISKNTHLSIAQRRRWTVNLRNGLIPIFFVGVIIIWSNELHSIVVSLAAFAVALVIATKEMLLSLSGGLLRGAARLYEVGDLISIGEHRGVVIDITLLTTTLMEEDSECYQRSSREIAVPNSLLWTSSVTRENLLGEYTVHRFSIPLAKGSDWRHAEKLLLELAQQHSTQATKQIQEKSLRMAKMHLNIPLPKTQITLQLKDAEQIILVVHVPTQLAERHIIEQQILRAYLEHNH